MRHKRRPRRTHDRPRQGVRLSAPRPRTRHAENLAVRLPIDRSVGDRADNHAERPLSDRDVGFRMPRSSSIDRTIATLGVRRDRDFPLPPRSPSRNPNAVQCQARSRFEPRVDAGPFALITPLPAKVSGPAPQRSSSGRPSMRALQPWPIVRPPASDRTSAGDIPSRTHCRGHCRVPARRRRRNCSCNRRESRQREGGRLHQKEVERERIGKDRVLGVQPVQRVFEMREFFRLKPKRCPRPLAPGWVP